MVALLGRRLPLHGLDSTVAHVPLAPGGDEQAAALLPFEEVPVIRLSQPDGRQWLETHRPDVISMHTPPDWLVAAAAELGIPTIENSTCRQRFF